MPEKFVPPPLSAREQPKFVPPPLSSKNQPAAVASPETSMLGKTADDYSRQFLNGLTFGFGDNMEAALAALPILGDKKSGESYGQAYDRNLKGIRGGMQSFQKENPKTAVALDIAGGTLPALLTGGGSTAGQVPSLLARVGRGAGVSAIYGGLGAAGNANQDSLKDLARNAAIGAGTGAVTGAALPLISAAMRRVAEGVADSSLGIRMNDRRYGKTPAAAILDETSGIRPAAIEDSARNRMTQLQGQLAAAGQGKTVDLTAAQDLAQALADKEARGINQPLATELQEAATALRDAPKGFYGNATPGNIAPLQSVPDASQIKREFSDRFLNWNSQRSPTASSRGKQVYRAIDTAIDQAVPEAAELNQRISSLIPVAQRAADKQLQAGAAQNILHRFGAPTGALLGTIAGYHYGGPQGSIAGLLGPAAIASTPFQMGLARTLNAPSKAPYWLTNLTRYGAYQTGRMLMPPPALNSPEGNQQ